MFTGHRQDLAEIRALAHEFHKSTQEVLERISEARDQFAAEDLRQAGTVVDGDHPLVAFVHIPKTAGATVTSMLVRVYSRAGVHNAGNYLKGPRKWNPTRVTRRPGDWESWQRRGGRLTAGHVPYRLFREHLPADTRYMTFLREPVDRVLSYYYRHIQPTGTAANERRPAADSLEQALEMRLPELNDLATRFLCGHPSSGTLPASALDEAKANLRDFAFVGITERFEESVVLLQRMLGLGLAPYLNRNINVDWRPAVDQIPDEQRALIADHNRLDAEVYTFAQGLFEDAVAVADDGLAADVETLRALTAGAHAKATQKARDWLDRELPTGTTKPKAALWSAAEAADVALEALKEVSEGLSVKKQLDHDGQSIWTRTEEAGHPPELDQGGQE